MDNPQPKTPTTMISYDEAHATAYRVLNRVESLLKNTDAGELLGLVKWRWQQVVDKNVYELIVSIRKQRIAITYPAMTLKQMDAFTQQWVDEAAEEIVAWMLLMKDTRKSA